MTAGVAVAAIAGSVETGLADGCLDDAQLEFLAALESLDFLAVIHGQGDVDEVGRKAALGGSDTLSRAVLAVAGRMWNQTGRRGFRAGITRFRFAARIVMRWLASGWLAFALALALEPEPEKAVPPVAPAPEVVTWRKIREQITDRMTVGPPAVVAVSEVRVIDP